MKTLKKLNSRQGSYTVEACIVVSAVLFTLFALIFSLLFLCQKAMLTSAAGRCAQKGAEIWSSDSFNTYTSGGLSDGYRTSLYYRLTTLNASDSRTIDISRDFSDEIQSCIKDYNTSTGTKKKMAWIKYQAYAGLDKCVLKPERTSISIRYKNYFIKSRLEVTITQEVKIPFGFIKALIDGKDTLTLNATGTANVTEPAEYIRNVDLAVEYGKKIKEGMKLDELLDRIKGEAAKE